MKLSLSWIKEYLDLTLPSEELAEALTLAGLEAEGVQEVDGDLIFEIGLTPNLGHCMSVVGIARELSAILDLPLKRKKVSFKESKEKASDAVSVKIEDERCLRYGCRVIKNVRVGPSPDWLKTKIERSGLRSVNNVVDVGNLIMLECGQPFHMFDYDQIEGKEIRVRLSKKEGKMATLDEVEREIPDGVLLICDGGGPVAFAGVMGERHSAVSDKTRNVLIEAAHFSPEAVRKTSKLLNLRTDSSQRFERGIDPLAVFSSLDFAAASLQEVAGGEILNGIVSEISQEYQPHVLELNPAGANRLLGTKLSIREMTSFLAKLEITVLSESEKVIKVEVPSYRNDLRAEIDLVEEVGRMFGFNNIPRSVARHASSMMTHAPLFLFEEQARQKLVAQGLQECLTCDLISPTLSAITMEKALDHSQIEVLHPASVDQSVLRTTLLPGLLQVVKFNIDRQCANIAAFEVGHIHFKDKENYLGEPVAGIVLTGLEHPYHFENKPDEVDFFVLKGHVESFLESIGVDVTAFEPSHLQNFHPNRQARVLVGECNVGVLGEVHPKHLQELGIGQRLFYAELNLHDLLDLKREKYAVTEATMFPGSERDWTITLDEKTTIDTIIKGINALQSPILENIFLLDLYKSDKIGKDKKNATFRFQYRDPNKTIEYQQIEKEHKRLTQSIAEKLANRVG